MNQTDLLCINNDTGFDIPLSEILEIIKSTGFDAFFYCKSRNEGSNQTELAAEFARKNGVIFQSVHAPFYGMDDIWHDEGGELAAVMEKDLIGSIDDCKRFDVPLVIMHAIIGMDNCTPTQTGIDRLGRIIDYAVKNGITIAFENTEGLMYLERIFENFGDLPDVGFCFDSGHEMCYNYSQDLLAKFGKYLVSTHLNDNLGMADINNMTFYDDSHLLPFDGIRDWNKTAVNLHKCNYEGILTFEVTSKSKPTRNANDRYKDMTPEQFYKEAYIRADRFRTLFQNT